MSCLEFRREKLADPRRLSPQAQAHAAGCTACAAFAREVDATESELDRALQTPVPEGFADRIILRTRGPRRAWRAWALAATVLLGIALGFAYLRQPPTDTYARLAIEHVLIEPESRTMIRDADGAALAAVIKNFGGSVKGPIGSIRYIAPCPVAGSRDWHIVLETPQGPATLVLVPDKRLAAVGIADANGWHALVRPARFGYYAIVTRSAESTSTLDRVLRERVDWNA